MYVVPFSSLFSVLSTDTHKLTFLCTWITVNVKFGKFFMFTYWACCLFHWAVYTYILNIQVFKSSCSFHLCLSSIWTGPYLCVWSWSQQKQRSQWADSVTLCHTVQSREHCYVSFCVTIFPLQRNIIFYMKWIHFFLGHLFGGRILSVSVRKEQWRILYQHLLLV